MSLAALFAQPRSDTASLGPLSEGLRDPHILKAVFLAGAGGAGKGAISDAMFAGLGLKVIDQDKHLVRFMKDAGLPLGEIGSHYEFLKQAQKLKGMELRHYAQRRLGIIVDSTGWDYQRIATPFKNFQRLGYDCSMVYVHTSLETAIRRNELRAKRGGRDVPVSYIKDAYYGAQRNFKKYVTLFGKPNVFVIDNDKDVEPKTWKSVISPKLRKIARRILDKPLTNPKGKAWFEKQRTAPDLDAPNRPDEWPEEKPEFSQVTYGEKRKKGGQGILFRKEKKGEPVKVEKVPKKKAETKKKKEARLPAPRPPKSSGEVKIKMGGATVSFGKKPGILGKLGKFLKGKNEATLAEQFAGIPLEEKDWRKNPKDFRYKLRIEPEKADPSHSVCSIGKSKKNGKWYGWSHRAYGGFGKGDKPYIHVPVNWGRTDKSFDDLEREQDEKRKALQAKAGPIKNDAEAKASAVAFANAVS